MARADDAVCVIAGELDAQVSDVRLLTGTVRPPQLIASGLISRQSVGIALRQLAPDALLIGVPGRRTFAAPSAGDDIRAEDDIR